MIPSICSRKKNLALVRAALVRAALVRALVRQQGFIFDAEYTEVRGVGNLATLNLSLSLHLSLSLGLGLGLKISNLGFPCSPAPSLDVVLEN